MTPLEKAKAAEGRVNYCDECGQFVIVGNGAFCKVDGKLIHPIMLVRGQGTGPAWACSKRKRPKTHYERIISMTPEEMAAWVSDHPLVTQYDENNPQHRAWLKWLTREGEAQNA